MSDAVPRAWDRQRSALRAEIMRVALDLFVRQGFEATTIDEIAMAAGISRRSFFRYFGTKEDVLLGDLVGRGEVLAAALAARPQEEDAWTALLAALRELRAGRAEDAGTELAIGRMMTRTPSLRARHLEKRLRWQELLVPLVAERIAAPDAELAAAAIVTTALSCLDVATDALVAADGEGDLEALYASALAAVRGQ